ncbi:MAG: hypothetical protein WBC61_01515, partial [Dehalococcoidia bacterium]
KSTCRLKERRMPARVNNSLFSIWNNQKRGPGCKRKVQLADSSIRYSRLGLLFIQVAIVSVGTDFLVS